MEELCAEGLAPHGDPESCVAFCEGRGEALTGARAGLAIEPRNTQDRGARVLMSAEGNTPGSASRELPGDPARPENHGMCGTFVRENREVPLLPDWRSREVPINVLYPHRPLLPTKVRSFVDFLSERFGGDTQ